MYWRKLGGPLLDRVPIRLHIDPAEGERKEYSLEELQSYVKNATEISREIATNLRELEIGQIHDLVPANIYGSICNIAESYGWSERRRYDLCRIWITIVFAFGVLEEKYSEYLDKAVSLMGNFAFPS